MKATLACRAREQCLQQNTAGCVILSEKSWLASRRRCKRGSEREGREEKRGWVKSGSARGRRGGEKRREERQWEMDGAVSVNALSSSFSRERVLQGLALFR